MKCYYGIFAKSLKSSINKPMFKDMKAAGITYNERMGFTSEAEAQRLLDTDKFDTFRDRLEVSEYGYL